MTAVQVRNVIDSLREFYGQLSSRFSQAQQQSGDAQMSLVFAKIAEREKEIEARLTRFENDTDDADLLQTWLPVNVEEILAKILNDFELQPGLNPSAVISQVLELDNKLVALFKDLASQTSISHVVELFESLATYQDAQTRSLAQGVRQE